MPKSGRADHQLFTGCFTIDKLVGKLDDSIPTRWFYYQAEHPDQRKRNGFEEWLDLEGKVAVKHNQHVMATIYLTVPSISTKVSNEGEEERVLEAHHYRIEASENKFRCQQGL